MTVITSRRTMSCSCAWQKSRSDAKCRLPFSPTYRRRRVLAFERPYPIRPDLAPEQFTSEYSRDEVVNAAPYSLSAFATTLSQAVETTNSTPVPPDPMRQAQEELANVKECAPKVASPAVSSSPAFAITASWSRTSNRSSAAGSGSNCSSARRTR